ncbi:MAG TPA: VCBS repeat-containing protein, partial [Planctomycetaceae bacterium]|nr:VCBS repeat-containing protein [Planctomycetaceae bacterium]
MKGGKVTTVGGIVLLAALACICAVVLSRLGPLGAERPRELILAMSQFKISFDENGVKHYTPGDGKVWIFHPDEQWRREQVFIPDSKAVQKATAFDIDGDGKNELVVAGGNTASIKWFKWSNGTWQEHDLWKPPLVRV